MKKLGSYTIFMEYELSVIWQIFGQMIFRSTMTIFLKKLSVKSTFGQKIFQSNDHSSKKLSVKRPFSQMKFRSNALFATLFTIKWHFFRKKIRSNYPFLAFGQTVFGQTVFGQMVFRSNGLSVKRCWAKWRSVKIFRWNDFSVKWTRTV
jgi:hypothetical protein